jgi:hypothetical protein
MIIASPRPKYLMTVVPSKSTRKPSLILKPTLPSSIEISCRLSKPKAGRLTVKSAAGRQIDESGDQHHSAYNPILESLEHGSNVRLESASHPTKQWSQRTSTDDGMQIDESDEQFENTSDSIPESREPDSNATLESALHSEKHFAQSHSTVEGIQTEIKSPRDEPDASTTYSTSKARPKTLTQRRGKEAG